MLRANVEFIERQWEALSFRQEDLVPYRCSASQIKKNYLQNFLGGFVFNDPVQLTVMVAPLCGVRPFPGLITSFFTPSAILSISLWTIPVFLANSQCRFQGQPSCALCALLFKALSDPTEKKSRKVTRDLGPKMKGETSVFTASPLFFLWSC